MAVFVGTMRIEGDRGAPLSVRAEVDGDRLTLETGGTELGNWPLAALEPEARGAGVGLTLDGDPVVIDVGNADAFLSAVARTGPKLRKGRKGKAAKPAKATRVKSERAPRQKPAPRVLVAVGAGLVLVVAAVLAPTLIGSIFLLIGLVLAMWSALAVVEPRVAVRIPLGLDSTHIMIGGVSALVVGFGLTFFG